MKKCLIANSLAGTGRRADVLRQIAAQTKCQLLLSDTPTDVPLLAKQAIGEGFDRIVVGGGDGTLSQVVNGVAPNFSAVELAVLPMGTGNDFARSIGVLADSLETAVATAVGNHVERCDLVKVVNGTTSYCLNAASGGFGGKIAGDVHREDKARWGAFAYWMTAVSKLVALDEYHLTLELDEEQVDMDLYGLAIANGRFIGGGFPISPSARIDDGLLDVTTIPVLPTMELMAAGLNFTLGRHQRDDRLTTFRSRRVHVRADPNVPFSIDGEPLAAVEASFEVIPKAIRVVVGDRPIALELSDNSVGQDAA